jgi:hypothetical protein
MLFGHYTAPEIPTSGCAYVARIDFEYGPRAFRRGEDFDYAALGLNESQARDLWVAGRLLVKEPAMTAFNVREGETVSIRQPEQPAAPSRGQKRK